VAATARGIALASMAAWRRKHVHSAGLQSPWPLVVGDFRTNKRK
jgi:hypothetical protein